LGEGNTVGTEVIVDVRITVGGKDHSRLNGVETRLDGLTSWREPTNLYVTQRICEPLNGLGKLKTA